MSIIKSLSVGNGDMFYIKHGSDNFTVIDCCINENCKEQIIEELKAESKEKGIKRFISTHPDDDHIRGLKYLYEQMNILNFYTVENEVQKIDETDDFKKYCELKNSAKFYLEKNCNRWWLNEKNDERKGSGINILWPDVNNKYYKKALKETKEGKSPNNICPIITYSLKNSIEAIWMGDLETEFMENIVDAVKLDKVDILFAPHHGRKSGRIPNQWLKKLDPKIIVIGEAPSEDLEYYQEYNTIKQNSSGDLLFDCVKNYVHIYVENSDYKEDFLTETTVHQSSYDNLHYLGSLKL